MEKQKICIIGGGLTGLITAITLSKLNLNIDLIAGDVEKNIKSNRTIAISQNNYNFVKKLNISNLSKKEFWPCSKMKLYGENKKEKFTEIFALGNNQSQKKKILYMTENSKIMRHMIQNIKKNKLISFKTQKIISKIISSGLLKSVKYNNNNNSKYNLIIICSGSDSNLVKTFFHDKYFKHFYEEISITTTLSHSSIKNNIVRQIFLDSEIFALLPISNTKTSVVWSVKKKAIYKYKDKKNLLLKNKIKFYAKNFLRNINLSANIEQKNLNLLIRERYYQDRILLFGDALHVVHPLVGQGFNMVLRDLINLEKILKNKINLGLDVGSSDILSEFSKEIKPRNFAYSVGIELIRNIFAFEGKAFKDLRNKIIIRLNKNNFIKDLFYNLADKGLKF